MKIYRGLGDNEGKKVLGENALAVAVEESFTEELIHEFAEEFADDMMAIKENQTTDFNILSNKIINWFYSGDWKEEEVDTSEVKAKQDRIMKEHLESLMRDNHEEVKRELEEE